MATEERARQALYDRLECSCAEVASASRAALRDRLNPNSDLGGAVGKARGVERTRRVRERRVTPPSSMQGRSGATGLT